MKIDLLLDRNQNTNFTKSSSEGPKKPHKTQSSLDKEVLLEALIYGYRNGKDRFSWKVVQLKLRINYPIKIFDGIKI